MKQMTRQTNRSLPRSYTELSEGFPFTPGSSTHLEPSALRSHGDHSGHCEQTFTDIINIIHIHRFGP